MFKSKLITERKDMVARGGRPGRGGARGDTSMDRQVQHGTLRSELDEPALLPPDFVRLADSVSALRGEYERGALTRSQAAERLAALKLVTSDGAEWTLGMTTGQWHRRYPGGEWGQAMPPEAAEEEFAATRPGVVDMLDAYFASESTDTFDVPADPVLASQLPADEFGIPEQPPVDGRSGWATTEDNTTFDVTGGQVSADVAAPYPEVSAEASHSPLPVFEPVAVPNDMQGLWGTGWVSVEREQSEDLEALFDAPAAERVVAEEPTAAPVTASSDAWSNDAWPDNTSLEDLFSTDDVDDVGSVVPSQVAASWAAVAAAPADTNQGEPVRADQVGAWSDDQVAVGGAGNVPVAFASGDGSGATDDDAVLGEFFGEPQDDSQALIARAREDMITDDPALADLLAEARGEMPHQTTLDAYSNDDDLGLPPELFDN